MSNEVDITGPSVDEDEEDKRMAAFLQSKFYGDEDWRTEEVYYTEWVQAGRPIDPKTLEPVKVEGFIRYE